jgi:hypothetical protein
LSRIRHFARRVVAGFACCCLSATRARGLIIETDLKVAAFNAHWKTENGHYRGHPQHGASPNIEARAMTRALDLKAV